MESKRRKDSELTGYLRKIIFNSGMTYETIAEKLGVSFRVVGFYCSGERKPSQKTLLRLLKITNANVGDIPF